MAIAEGVQGTIAYKAYASGLIDENTQDNAPGAANAFLIRRVSSSLNLVKPSYQSAEIRSDRQMVDSRQGVGSVTGDIQGELSPLTYFDFLEAVHRDTRAAFATFTEADFTSVAASSGASTFTLGSGDPVASNLTVGDIIRFDGLPDGDNSTTDFMIISFSGASNRVIHVLPAPTTGAADTAFFLRRPGARTLVPSSAHVSRKFGIEVNHPDIDLSRLFCECRIAGYSLTLPATGLATISISVVGRDMLVLDAADAPYFTAPADETTTNIAAAVNGILLLKGAQVGIVTGVTINHTMANEIAPVVGQNFTAGITLGRNIVSGQLTAYLTDATLLENFVTDTELELLLKLTTTSDAESEAMTIFLPAIKLTSTEVALTGEGGQIITAAFQALKYTGVTPGIPNTTIRIVDTEVV